MNAAFELGNSVGKAVACRAIRYRVRRSIGACCRRLRAAYAPRRRVHWIRLSAMPCSIICTRSASVTGLQRRSMQP
jgi:hypothetical protein